MRFIQNIIEKHQKKVQEQNAMCNELIDRCDDALREVKSLFTAPTAFIDPTEATKWIQQNKDLFERISNENIKKAKKAAHFNKLRTKQNDLYVYAENLLQQIQTHNNRAAKLKIQTAYQLIGDVEGRTLDELQMTCIVKEAHNHLVIAGAGTGKTTTVVGKIKYLLKSNHYTPEEILVLSFTNASAAEMSQRIHAETRYPIEASTFHKLGLNIIKKATGVVPKISQLNLHKFIKEQLLQNMDNPRYLHLLGTYLLFNRVITKSEFEFKTKQEYDEYLRLNPPTTIKNETVKSYGEMDIANFFVQNGINYIYEHPYARDTRTSEYGQYCPDFFLPDYNIYIEYFGINKAGEVPTYFTGKGKMSASEAYRASMDWKRKLHAENHTAMIECYAYEKFDGILLENLAKNYKRPT